MQRIYIALVIITCFLFVSSNLNIVSSIECNPGVRCNTNEECQLLEKLCTQKASELAKEVDSYLSQKQSMITQIYLTELKIKDTEQKITTITNEIEVLGSRIEGLDTSLSYLSKLLVKQIAEGYKKRTVSLFSLLFDSANAEDLLDRIKYLKSAQDNNQKVLIQVQEAKLNFEEQKKLREEKIKQLDNLKNTLNAQNITLNSQKIALEKLINDTQDNENIYRELSNQARQQISAFKSFVTNTGAGIINANQFGNGSDGNYYSQRDSRWANNRIGYSGETILDVGCLLTSVAMTAKKFGSNLTPADIASDVSRFFSNTAYMKLPWPSVAGKSYVGGVNIDQELQNGNYVIVGVGGCYNGGSHFVVLTKKDGDTYTMHDPIYGPDIKFSSHYSNICSSATFK